MPRQLTLRSARFHVMVPQCSRPSLFSPDSLIEAAEVEILKHEAERAAKQSPWDGEKCVSSSRCNLWNLWIACLQLHGTAVS